MSNNIERNRGDTYADEFTIIDPKTRRPVNITGATFLLTVDPDQYPEDDTNNLFQLTGEILDAARGRVAFAPSEEQADNLGSFYYDIQMVASNGAKRTVRRGRYKFVQDITKD